ncbi:MAG: hypothetical protein IJZ88_01750 [Clostridia bacterium]|nr:hypothetical protein [Clostridia bacterium]
MTKSAKIISLLLSVVMLLSVVSAMAISSFAADAPTISVVEKSRDGEKIILNVVVSEGYVNAVDIKFTMSGVKCESVKDLTGAGMGNANASGNSSHYSVASTQPLDGDLAQVVIKVTNEEKYSFSLNIDECMVTKDIEYDEYGNITSIGENVNVKPNISGTIKYEKPTTTTTTTTKKTTTTTTTKKADTSSTTTTKKTTTTTTTKRGDVANTTTTTTTTRVNSLIPTNTLPDDSSLFGDITTSSDVDTSSSTDLDFDSYGDYDYNYVPDETEAADAEQEEILDDSDNSKTLIIAAAVIVALIAAAVVAFILINKKKKADSSAE